MLKSPLLTAEWETRLTEIAKGSDDPQSFMQGIEDMTRELVKRYYPHHRGRQKAVRAGKGSRRHLPTLQKPRL